MECLRDCFRRGQLLDGRFKTVAPLNHGSFGMVFLADDLQTRQQVAIKCLTKPSAASSDLGIPFDEAADELACHAILQQHPHLVNLVHHFETRSHNYLVLEYCSQGDLYEAIRVGHGPLETQHVKRFMLQLISAVEHMHANGLYHRDIKPENIFLTADGSMKLGDFGLATRSLWSYESCVGSDRYMAPEQYNHAGNGYNPAKADLWSIGICLLNILFSRNPFVTPTESDVLFSDYVRDRQSLFDIFPNLSQDTFEILSIAMAIDPNKRDLHALRYAVQKTLNFTMTGDEDMDEYCLDDQGIIQASADREPLRTPSIRSPLTDGDSFPWAQIRSPAKPVRQLSTVPSEYDEDLFASDKSRQLGSSWFSGHYNTPSTASAFGSTFSGSLRSVNIQPVTAAATAVRRPRLPTIPSSLPVLTSQPIPTMSRLFGKKDTTAKSWSDMWEEDEEEIQESALRARRAFNARSFSNEMHDEPAVDVVPVQSQEQVKQSAVRKASESDSADGENSPRGKSASGQPKTPKQSPHVSPVDKWSELGNRRRQPTIGESSVSATKIRASINSSSSSSSTKKRTGSNQDQYNRRQSRNKSDKSRPAYLDQDWRQRKAIDSDDDHEWVGGWHNFHL